MPRPSKTPTRASLATALAAALVIPLACQPGDGGTETDADTTSSSGETTAGPATSTSATEASSTASATTAGDSETGDTGTEPPEVGVAVAPGGGFSCMLDGTGTIHCFGSNSHGQLGDGTMLSSSGTQTAHEEAWVTLDAGALHVCAIDTLGALYCWGDQHLGAVGDGTMPDFINEETGRPLPVKVGHDGPWLAVSAGRDNSCAIDGENALWCWGPNEEGQLGNGGVGDSWAAYAPGEVTGGASWRAVATTSGHTCGVQTDGTLWCWGDNKDGQLGDGTTDFTSTPIQVGGDADWDQVTVSASLYHNHTCAIKQDGSLWCWGANDFGGLGVGDEEPRLTPTEVMGGGVWTSVAALFHSTCATRDDGTLWCWGGNTSSGVLANGGAGVEDSYSAPQQVGAETGWRGVQLEGSNGCAVQDEERGFCWGDNGLGALGVMTSGPYEDHYSPVELGTDLRNPPAADWAQVSVGGGHTCGRTTSDELWCWGNGAGGDLGSGFDDVECNMANPGECRRTAPRKVVGGGAWAGLSAGGAGACGLRPDGTLWCWGGGELNDEAAYSPAQVGVASDWSAIELSDGHYCGLRDPGTLWCWGSNSRGQIGNGQGGQGMIVDAPTQVGAAEDWLAVSRGFLQTCAIRQPGTLWCWGANDRGQLGVGSSGMDYNDASADEPLPVQVGAADDWAQVCGGRYHSCGVRGDGTLWCWGLNSGGMLGEGPIDDAVVSDPQQVGGDTDWQEVACGETIACGRKADGAVHCWGSSSQGALGTGDPELVESGAPIMVEPLGAAQQLSSGRVNQVCARLEDHSAWCWGAGPLGDHNVFSSPTPRQVVEGDELP